MNYKYAISLAAGVLFLAASCSSNAVEKDSWQALLSESDRLASLREWEPATEYALKALSAPNLTDGSKSLTFSRLASLDIITWRDAQGWEHAVEAERLARADRTDSLLALALLQKGRLQLVGAITEGEAQDQDALETLKEALSHTSGNPDIQADILLQMSQAYIGLNRFSNPIDQELYAMAGSYIEQAVTVAKAADFPSKAMPYRIRWYRQGGAWEDGIECCLDVLDNLDKEDYLMQSQCWNNLVMLYAQSGDVEKTANAHQQYVYAMEYYMKQKADSSLQEMETRYETTLKEARLSRMRIWMVLLIILAATLIVIIALSQLYIRRIVASDHGKEQLLRLISKNLTSPQSGNTLSELKDEAAIRERCRELLGSEDDTTVASEVASYIINLAEERSREIKKLGLTARELEVIRLSAEGLSAAGIAERLHVSVYTIKNHKQNIYLKMDVKSNSEMLRRAKELDIA